MAKKNYRNGNSAFIPPVCGCEARAPFSERKFGHTKKREVNRGVGLTPYQIEQQAERRRLIVARSRS